MAGLSPSAFSDGVESRRTSLKEQGCVLASEAVSPRVQFMPDPQIFLTGGPEADPPWESGGGEGEGLLIHPPWGGGGGEGAKRPEAGEPRRVVQKLTWVHIHTYIYR